MFLSADKVTVVSTRTTHLSQRIELWWDSLRVFVIEELITIIMYVLPFHEEHKDIFTS